MRLGTRTAVVALLACGILTGCAATPSAGAPVTQQPDSASTPAADTGVDAAIASTCAGFSAIETTTMNAQAELQAGLISQDQYVTIVNSTSVAFRTLSDPTADQRGLQEEIDAIVRLTGEGGPSAELAYDPAGPEYTKLRTAVFTACEENGSEEYLVGLHGG